MSETRKVEQYKIYTIHENVVKVVGKKDGKEVTRTDRVPVAVFDDKKALSAFQKAQDKTAGHESWEVVEDWVESKPSATMTSLPFNPEPNADLEEGSDDNDNGDN